ncbi:MAG: fibronectin type III domain-containing protein [Paludibacteraceae bacterium]|nr:fibronectin type III domain-containing protein [Paludibacteraceae bacterium]
MKKLFLLLAITACWCGLNAANVNVRLLIPTDSKFSTDGTVIFSWSQASGSSNKAPRTKSAATDIALSREGSSRWWSAIVIIPDETAFTYSIYTQTSTTTKDEASIMGNSPSSYVAKDKPLLTLELMALAYTETDGNRTFMCGEVPATTEDHDYSITDLNVEDIGNGINITWNTNNLAPNYCISIMDDSYQWDHTEFITVTEGKYTYLYDGAEDIHIGKVLFYPCYYEESGTGIVIEMHPYVEMFELDVDINFKSPGSIISESLKAEQKGNTIEISWDHASIVTRYSVYVEYANAPVADYIILPEYMPAESGKYVLTVDNLIGNGVYRVSFYADDVPGHSMVTSDLTVPVSGLPALGDVELNVLIPSDNDMDITYGVWFDWWDVETETHTFVKADMDGEGVWFSSTINTTASAIYFRVCNRPDASGSNSDKSPLIQSNKVCYEMPYQRSGMWVLNDVDCAATDHNYTINNIQATSYANGFIQITITAEDYAPYYEVSARETGSGSYYKIIATLPYSGSNTFVAPSPFSQTGDYDYQVKPENANYQPVAPTYEGTINIIGNINIPTNLTATVQSDNQTVDFSWTYSGMGVDHYTLIVDDEQFTNISGTSFTQKFYLSGYHYWSVYAYGSTGTLLGMADCETDFEISAPYYDPSDLSVSVSGTTATLTWTAPADVAAGHIIVYELGGSEVMNAVVSSNSGQFSASYTLQDEDRTVIYDWKVTSMTADGMLMSYDVFGPMFAIVGSAVSAIDETVGDKSSCAKKILRDGRIVILRDGKEYDITGMQLK